MSEIVRTPNTPYYAVIFTSIRTLGDNGYTKVGEEIINMVSKQKGFIGAESVRGEDGFGITTSYWDSLESINEWKKNIHHNKAKEMGKNTWYSKYMIRICKVEGDNYFDNH